MRAGLPPVLFLHGAFNGAEVFTRFMAPWFAQRGFEVSVPRLPGALGNVSARLRDYVRTARQAADALGGAPVVIAHSLGGLVAQHLAAERRLPGVVLIGSPGRSASGHRSGVCRRSVRGCWRGCFWRTRGQGGCSGWMPRGLPCSLKIRPVIGSPT